MLKRLFSTRIMIIRVASVPCDKFIEMHRQGVQGRQQHSIHRIVRIPRSHKLKIFILRYFIARPLISRQCIVIKKPPPLPISYNAKNNPSAPISIVLRPKNAHIAYQIFRSKEKNMSRVPISKQIPSLLALFALSLAVGFI